jgi:tripartite-type tricarboxylate transporter receptor subunit TctC
MGGEIHLLFDSTLTAITHVRGGRVKGLAIASLKRNAALPDTPTFDEGGVPAFESSIAHGILVPGKTPEATVVTLNRALNDVLNDAAYRKPMLDLGADLFGGSAREFVAFLDAERRKWRAVIERRGIRAG